MNIIFPFKIGLILNNLKNRAPILIFCHTFPTGEDSGDALAGNKELINKGGIAMKSIQNVYLFKKKKLVAK